MRRRRCPWSPIIVASPALEYHVGIKQLPATERPRERLLHHGAEQLNDEELLAIVLGSATARISALELARKMIAESGGLEALSRASVSELTRFPGIGEVRAVELMAVFELVRRIARSRLAERPQLTSPGQVATYLKGDLSELEQEHLVVVLVDTKNRVMGQSTVCTGSLNSAAVRVGEIFKEAVRRNAAGVILAHNHPSGDPSPSSQDLQLTEAARKAGELLDV
jgi:DNA repair protein RadC